MSQYPTPSPIEGTSNAYSKDNLLLRVHQRTTAKYVPPETLQKITEQVSSYLLVHEGQRLFTALDQLLKHHSL